MTDRNLHRRQPPAFGEKSSPVDRAVDRHARRLVNTHGAFRPDDLDDVCQELRVAVHRGRDRFNPEKVPIGNYLDRVLQNRAVSLIRKSESANRDWRREACSLNTTVRDGEGDCVERARTLDASASTRHTGQERRDELELIELQLDVRESLPSSKQLRQVAELLMEMPEHAVARKLGLSRREVANAVRLLEKLFRSRNLHHYF